MFGFLQKDPNARNGAAVLAVTYQSDLGASGGSLKRAYRGSHPWRFKMGHITI